MIIEYNDKYEKIWDMLVLEESINGNFLQTRNFLNYHQPKKFVDNSLLFFKGDELVAVIPANEIEDGQILISHQGSTFGGLVISKQFATISNFNWIFYELMEYIKKKGYKRVEFRMPNWLYARDERHYELLDYYFHLNGFSVQAEVGFFIDINSLEPEFEKKYDQLRRRKLKKSLKSNLQFRKLDSNEEIKEFYNTLADNMLKFKTTPLHSYENMLDFKNNRLENIVSFYGVFHENDMIAGSMVFNFCDKKVFHTQYLASRYQYLDLCPNEYLYTQLIKEAQLLGYRYLSFGTATLEHGAVFNENLALYKEGYNTETYVNRTYVKEW